MLQLEGRTGSLWYPSGFINHSWETSCRPVAGAIGLSHQFSRVHYLYLYDDVFVFPYVFIARYYSGYDWFFFFLFIFRKNISLIRLYIFFFVYFDPIICVTKEQCYVCISLYNRIIDQDTTASSSLVVVILTIILHYWMKLNFRLSTHYNIQITIYLFKLNYFMITIADNDSRLFWIWYLHINIIRSIRYRTFLLYYRTYVKLVLKSDLVDLYYILSLCYNTINNILITHFCIYSV